MSTIIEADAAKLAGLQIDLLQKIRSGQVTLGQLERFSNLSVGDREARFGDVKKVKTASPEKFGLFVDLGIITVPKDYDHASRLKTFRKEHFGEFYYYNDDISDKHFPKPSRILKPGDKLHVRVFKQIVRGTTTSEERMAFLATQKAVHTGAQGVSLVWEQKRDQLPKDKWYCSFDEKEVLWKDAGGYHRVPFVYRYSDGDFGFDLGSFEDGWGGNDCLLCFCDMDESSGA